MDSDGESTEVTGMLTSEKERGWHGAMAILQGGTAHRRQCKHSHWQQTGKVSDVRYITDPEISENNGYSHCSAPSKICNRVTAPIRDERLAAKVSSTMSFRKG